MVHHTKDYHLRAAPSQGDLNSNSTPALANAQSIVPRSQPSTLPLRVSSSPFESSPPTTFIQPHAQNYSHIPYLAASQSLGQSHSQSLGSSPSSRPMAPSQDTIIPEQQRDPELVQGPHPLSTTGRGINSIYKLREHIDQEFASIMEGKLQPPSYPNCGSRLHSIVMATSKKKKTSIPVPSPRPTTERPSYPEPRLLDLIPNFRDLAISRHVGFSDDVMLLQTAKQTPPQNFAPRTPYTAQTSDTGRN